MQDQGREKEDEGNRPPSFLFASRSVISRQKSMFL
jgi:hypothetical protein